MEVLGLLLKRCFAPDLMELCPEPLEFQMGCPVDFICFFWTFCAMACEVLVFGKGEKIELA